MKLSMALYLGNVTAAVQAAGVCVQCNGYCIYTQCVVLKGPEEPDISSRPDLEHPKIAP